MTLKLDYSWLEGDQALADLCQLFTSKSWIVLDTEFVRETTYYAIPGLLQFSDGESNWLVDPLTISNWQPLQQLLCSDLIWVMHACNEDLEVLHRLTGATPQNLFDTQIAAQFIGMGHALGYQKLIIELSGVHLDKGESRTNWIRRPLSDKQLDYATNDVHYLAIAWQQLQQELSNRQLLDFFVEDMLVVSNWQPVDKEKAYLKVKLAWQIQQQDEVNRLQALSNWRESQAQQRDKPKRHILADETLLQMARDNPALISDFEKLKLLRSRQVAAIGNSLLEVLRKVESQQNQYPAVTRSVEISGSKMILKKWKSIANEIATNNELPASILFTNGLLDSFFKYSVGLEPATPKMWTSWRNHFLNEAFTEILKTEHLL